jgi:hypothetical protein
VELAGVVGGDADDEARESFGYSKTQAGQCQMTTTRLLLLKSSDEQCPTRLVAMNMLPRQNKYAFNNASELKIC